MVLDSRRPQVDGPQQAVAPVTEPRRRAFSDLGGRMPSFVAITGAVAWFALLVLMFNLEPAPDPDQPVSATGLVLSMSFWYTMLAMFSGMAARRRWGLAASMVGGGLLLSFGILCLATGHSGIWLTAQVAGGATMLAGSFAGLKATA